MSTTEITSPGPAAPPGRGGPGPDFAFRRSSPRRLEAVIRYALRFSAFLSILITLGIVTALLVPALTFFREVSVVDFLTGTRWAPQFADASFGVLPLVTATAWTTFIALAVAIPFGLGAAIYLSEYAHPKA